jgi:hypothetical protein
MYTCVVRVSGPAVAYAMVPSVFDISTGSSFKFRFCHAAETAGSPAIPNCTTNPGTTRKKPALFPGCGTPLEVFWK